LDSFIVDLDGTVLNGTEELNYATKFLHHLENTGTKYLLATNSIQSHQVQVQRLKNIGFPIIPEKIYSPIDSINEWIRQKSISNVLIIGSHDEIYQINANHTYQEPELILLLDFEKNNTTYNDLQMILNKVEKGCPIIAASRSPYYLKEGRKQIDTGAFVHLIESITDQRIEVFGKPSSHYFLNAQSILESEPHSITVIGDDWATDIVGAKEVGFGSILIKSGKYREGDEGRGQPDLLIDNFLAILSKG